MTTAILGVYLYTSSSFIGELRCYWLEMKRVTSSSVFHGNFKQSEEQGDMGGASARAPGGRADCVKTHDKLLRNESRSSPSF